MYVLYLIDLIRDDLNILTTNKQTNQTMCYIYVWCEPSVSSLMVMLGRSLLECTTFIKQATKTKTGHDQSQSFVLKDSPLN